MALDLSCYTTCLKHHLPSRRLDMFCPGFGGRRGLTSGVAKHRGRSGVRRLYGSQKEPEALEPKGPAGPKLLVTKSY